MVVNEVTSETRIAHGRVPQTRDRRRRWYTDAAINSDFSPSRTHSTGNARPKSCLRAPGGARNEVAADNDTILCIGYSAHIRGRILHVDLSLSSLLGMHVRRLAIMRARDLLQEHRQLATVTVYNSARLVARRPTGIPSRVTQSPFSTNNISHTQPTSHSLNELNHP
ncbi:hypothetical protein M0802_007623 [Mischocyttarus mexicanus]|nr:hypothetical protein M0802_007623 [Mischocyttarus mexicanus]